MSRINFSEALILSVMSGQKIFYVEDVTRELREKGVNLNKRSVYRYLKEFRTANPPLVKKVAEKRYRITDAGKRQHQENLRTWDAAIQ